MGRATLSFETKGRGEKWRGRAFTTSEVMDMVVGGLNLGEGVIGRAELPVGEVGPAPREVCLGAFLEFAVAQGFTEAIIDGTLCRFEANEDGFQVSPRPWGGEGQEGGR